MKCLIKANTIYENMYPLTKDVPAGLLSIGGRPVVDYLLEDLESSGKITEFFVVVCEEYRTKVLKWKEGHGLKDKIKVLSEGEAAGISGEETGLSDVLEVPAELFTDFSIGRLLREEEDVAAALREGETVLINSLPIYEDYNHRRLVPKDYEKFQVEAFTQERYGDIFISRISMAKRVLCGESHIAKIRLHNLTGAALTPENTTLRYRLWREQTYEDRFEVDRILMPDCGQIALPVTLEAGGAADMDVEVQIPIQSGKFFLKFDLAEEEKQPSEEVGHLLFPSVCFIADYYYDVPENALLAMPKVILAGSPESANAGEQLEAAAIKEFMEQYFPGYKFMDFTARRLEQFWKLGGAISNEKDIIVSYGSGWMGLPEKMEEEHLRRRTASAASMPKMWLKFISMPQHVAFSETENGKKEVKHSATAYSGKNYFLAGAAEADYQFMKHAFTRSRISKAPLLSFGMTQREEKVPTGDDFTVVVCGGGQEGFLDAAYQAIDSNQLRRMYLNLDYNAYQPGAWFGERSRNRLIDFCCGIIQDTRAVVTDTFYGLAYALICGRPCVVYHQSQDGEWFRERDDVIFVERLEEIEEACKRILGKEGKGPLSSALYQPFLKLLNR